MRQLARLGCAALALLVIAGLTSIGLYAIVAGGLLSNVPVPRSVAGVAPVLVTIQAGAMTPTPASASTEIPAPGPSNPSKPGQSLATPVAAPAPAPAPASGAGGSDPAAAASTTGAGTPSSGSAAPGAGPSSPAPASGSAVPNGQAAATGPPPSGRNTTSNAVAGRSSTAGQPAAQGAGGSRAVHDGLAAEIVDVEHNWTPTGIDGTTINVQPGLDMVTVMIQLTNTSGELRYVGEGDILLVGSDGTRFAPRPTPLAREPRLLTMPILPGDVVKGWQTYAVPPGVTIARAQWNPSRADRSSAGAAYNLELPR